MDMSMVRGFYVRDGTGSPPLNGYAPVVTAAARGSLRPAGRCPLPRA